MCLQKLRGQYMNGRLLWLLLRTTAPAVPNTLLLVTLCSIGILLPPLPSIQDLTPDVGLKPLKAYTLKVVFRTKLVMVLVCGRWRCIWRMTMSIKHRFFISFLSGMIIGSDLQSEIRFETSIIELLSNLCCHDLNIVCAHFELIGE